MIFAGFKLYILIIFVTLSLFFSIQISATVIALALLLLYILSTISFRGGVPQTDDTLLHSNIFQPLLANIENLAYNEQNSYTNSNNYTDYVIRTDNKATHDGQQNKLVSEATGTDHQNHEDFLKQSTTSRVVPSYLTYVCIDVAIMILFSCPYTVW